MNDKYYSLNNILSKNAIYNIIFGERSNGKTFAVLEYGIKKWFESGEKDQIGIIRRWDEDFKGKNGDNQFNGFVENKKGNFIEKLTKGKYNAVKYQSRRWYMSKRSVNEKGEIDEEVCERPFAIAFALTNCEHYKSISFDGITTILFDEYITRKYYLPQEFIDFQNLLSTIIRDRDNVIIFMCGNSVNKYCVHHIEMGLTHIPKMKKGDIDVYNYGESGLVVAVEYSDSPSKKGKKSDKYFAFDNPKLKMITSGEWEIDIYPHLPYKYMKNDIIYNYFIEFNNELLHCEIIRKGDDLFTFIHRKTTPIKEDEKGMIYSEISSPKNNHRRKITKPSTKIEKKILSFFIRDKVFYQDNEVGEIVRNYLIWCKTSEN